MSGNTQSTKPASSRARSVLTWIALIALLVCATLYTGVKLFLASSYAPAYAGRFLSGFLQQTVTIEGLSLSGGSLRLNLIAIANPAGLPSGNLLVAESITIAPEWRTMSGPDRRFSLIRINGLRVQLNKDNKGIWNFDPLRQQLGRKKGGGGTTFVRRLELARGSLMVEGRGIGSLTCALDNFSTKADEASPLTLSFSDGLGNPYQLKGRVKGGREPEIHLALDSQSISLAALAGLAPKGKLPVAAGTGKLHLDAGYVAGRATVAGRIGFERLAAQGKFGASPVSGALEISGTYTLAEDLAIIDKVSLALDGLATVNGRGKLLGVRRERRFEVSASSGELSLERLLARVPALPPGIAAAGFVSCPEFLLAGDGAQGITSLSAKLRLRDGALRQGGRQIVSGLGAEVDLFPGADGFSVRGGVHSPDGKGSALIENLEAPVLAVLNSRLKLVSAEFLLRRANLFGIPLTGRGGFAPAAPVPLTGELSFRDVPLRAMNTHLQPYGLEMTDGMTTLAIDLKGQNFKTFDGTVETRLANARGKRGERSFSLGDAQARTRLNRVNGRFAAGGEFKLAAGKLDGRDLAGSFSYHLEQGKVELADGSGRFDRAVFRFARIGTSIPRREAGPEGTVSPLEFDLQGGGFSFGNIGLEGLNGSLRARLISGKSGKWLAGTGSAAVSRIIFRGENAGGLTAQARLGRDNSSVELKGDHYGGKLVAALQFNSLRSADGIAFESELSGVEAGKLATLLPKGDGFGVGGGKLGVRAKGRYLPSAGVSSNFEISGTGINLLGKGKKTLLSGAGFALKGQVLGKDLTLNEGAITGGNDLALRFSGNVSDFATAGRKGEFNYALPATQANSIIDLMVNLLPPALQDGAADGTIAAKGSLSVQGKSLALNGKLKLELPRIELPGQKIRISEIRGSVPYSISVPGIEAEKPSRRMTYSRENYPAILSSFRDGKAKPNDLPLDSLKIGGVRFGPLELDETVFRIHARNGLTELVTLSSGLYRGKVFGTGFFRYRQGVEYEADLLIDSMSLREMCNAFPAIKGYVSGQLDGILSLYGEKGGMDELAGYTNLWTRNGPDEKMLVSKEFLQKLAGKKLRGFFFREDRTFDQGEISAYLEKGFLTFEQLDVVNTNFFGVKDLSVSVAPVQNRIELVHLLNAIKQAAARGKAAKVGEPAAGAAETAPPEAEFQWRE